MVLSTPPSCKILSIKLYVHIYLILIFSHTPKLLSRYMNFLNLEAFIFKFSNLSIPCKRSMLGLGEKVLVICEQMNWGTGLFNCFESRFSNTLSFQLNLTFKVLNFSGSF